MSRHATIGKCKICGEQKEMKFMNFCYKCYEIQMVTIRKEKDEMY